jgi:hypothetical protein
MIRDSRDELREPTCGTRNWVSAVRHAYYKNAMNNNITPENKSALRDHTLSFASAGSSIRLDMARVSRKDVEGEGT